MSNIGSQEAMQIMSRYEAKRIIGKILLYFLTAIIIIGTIFPFYWLVTTSIKYGADAMTSPPIIVPGRVTLENYIAVFKKGIFKELLNSIIVSISTTFLAVLFGALAAYSLSKTYIGPKIRGAFLIGVLVVRIFPPVVTTMPYFLIITKMGLFDTQISMIITYVAYSIPFVIWLMLGFFQELPPEIDKAAVVDGCNLWQRFSKVTLPLALPGLAVTSIFCFIMAWNEFLYASVLTSQNAKTLPVLVAGFISDQRIQWGPMTAIGVMLVIPVLLFAIFTQKYLVRGLTFGAVKG
ncbi:MAG: carbohydrate ABC transporter permease [Actinobacteria bacterium]|nr:carbohydrate ABC transporter permease [Actinomycetota bacterium]